MSNENKVQIFTNDTVGFQKYLKDFISKKNFDCNWTIQLQPNEQIEVSYMHENKEVKLRLSENSLVKTVRENYPLKFNLVLQLEAKQISITIPARTYKLDMIATHKFDKNFIELLLKKPANWKKIHQIDSLDKNVIDGCFSFEEKILTAEVVDLTKFISNFQHFEDWLYEKLNKSLEEDLNLILKGKYLSKTGLFINPINEFQSFVK